MLSGEDMKLRKLQAALKKAQLAEKSAKAAYAKVIGRTGLISEAWGETKAKYKAARKELKRMRKESALAQAAHKAAKRCYEQSSAFLEKLTRKLRKAEKKGAAKSKIKPNPAPAPKAKKSKPAVSKKTSAAKPKAGSKPGVTVPILAETESFPDSTAAQA